MSQFEDPQAEFSFSQRKVSLLFHLEHSEPFDWLTDIMEDNLLYSSPDLNINVNQINSQRNTRIKFDQLSRDSMPSLVDT